MNIERQTRSQPATDRAAAMSDSQHFRLEDSVTYWIVRLFKIVNNEFTSKTRTLGVTVGAVQALSVLAESDGLTVGELSKICFIEQPTLTKILNRLESDKLVRRKVSKRDKRLVQIYITPAGRKLNSKMLMIIEEIENRTLAGISPQEVKSAMTLLRKMNENASIRAVI